MNRKFEAEICWISEKHGGRKNIPFSDKYAPIIKIANPLFESYDYWSIFVFNKKELCKNKTLADIEYLSDVAPDNLSAGVEFVLYEGQKKVASGVVLRETFY